QAIQMSYLVHFLKFISLKKRIKKPYPMSCSQQLENRSCLESPRHHLKQIPSYPPHHSKRQLEISQMPQVKEKETVHQDRRKMSISESLFQQVLVCRDIVKYKYQQKTKT